ncbi:anthrone oxygenase family protein [Fodinicola feengrottensis]|uniref:DUF1772 domain-containing protein n=1 Tax=Fodinicola feengrottensis TaxID=435914 RepID=A0ABN2G7B4_9ACTN|nr:DUF1772 domain-containing protein [Fodinicola feengrottensis]
MLVQTLGTLVLVTSGIAAGVLFTHAVGVWPALQAMSPEQYVAAHKLIGRAYDPMMPIIVVSSTVLAVILAVLDGRPPARALFVLAAVFLVGVSIVSQTRNVPINKRVKALDEVPAGWHDPRRSWGRWNLARTSFALVAFAALAVALTFH